VSLVRRDTWRYDLTAHRWEQLYPQGSPVAGAHFGYAFDSVCQTLYLSAGDNLDNYDLSFTDGLLVAVPQFRRLPAGTMPPPRDHPTLSLDPTRRRLVLFGGGTLGDGLGLLGDTWTFSLEQCL
jgi:hypothetical protein